MTVPAGLAARCRSWEQDGHTAVLAGWDGAVRGAVAVTDTVVGTVPSHLAGMASATTSMLRDFGFTLGPAVIGAVAAAQSSAAFQSGLASSSLPTAVKTAAGHLATVAGTPFAVEDQPPTSLVGKAASVAVHALGHGYAVGYFVSGMAAVVCCVFTVLALNHQHGEQASDEPAAEPATA